ncbi:MAG: hypothetical protein AAFV45_08790 [Pseudomonadota bacterium]
MAITDEQLNHLAGEGVVVRRWYANDDRKTCAVVTTLPSSEEAEAWQCAAFTNGGPLVKLEIEWNPKEAEKLK